MTCHFGRVQAYGVVLLCLPLNTFFEDAFPKTQFGAWRHILTPHCLTPHFGLPPHLCLTPHFDATLFDATFPWFRRRHHICAWRHILTPHCLTPHFHDFGGATTFGPDATFWRHIAWRHIFHLAPRHFGHTFGDKLFFFPPDFGLWNGTSYGVPFGTHVSGYFGLWNGTSYGVPFGNLQFWFCNHRLHERADRFNERYGVCCFSG